MEIASPNLPALHAILALEIIYERLVTNNLASLAIRGKAIFWPWITKIGFTKICY